MMTTAGKKKDKPWTSTSISDAIMKFTQDIKQKSYTFKKYKHCFRIQLQVTSAHMEVSWEQDLFQFLFLTYQDQV